MTRNPSYTEDASSQVPALMLLQRLGYTYLTPDEALAKRGHRRSNVILDEVLAEQLGKINRIRYKGKEYPFSTENIHNAIQALKRVPYDGLVRTNEQIYDLLTLGKSLPQAIMGDTRSHTMRYIDWEHPENNVYHVTDEFEVERSRTHQTRRPDIVLFVNGIPLVVIECKRPDLQVPGGGQPVDQAVSQMIRNQKEGEIPNLFTYSQLVIGIAMNAARYGTTGTAAKFWSIWKEEDIDDNVEARVNQPLELDKFESLFAPDYRRHLKGQFQNVGHLAPTEQNRLLYSICRPERLLRLAYQYVLFDLGVKKIARYQQYFAIQETLKRIRQWDQNGRRKGGIIWHTTGTGKSITMVMLAKALALEPSVTDPRIVLVTDRIDLDGQIHATFMACGKSAVRARTGKHLIQLIEQSKESIITAVIDKFISARKQRKVKNLSQDLFVLVDEGHRGQSGYTSATMRAVFPNACYIAYTGTPLLRGDKATVNEFGGIIHKYTIDQAEKDGMVVPLLYEGRMAVLEQNKQAIDTWFDRVTHNLSDEQKKDLRRKFTRLEKIQDADQRIRQIAFDISRHYSSYWKGTGFKAQLATPNKATALRYKEYLDQFGEVTSEVIISSPDSREGHDEVGRENRDEVQKFWQHTMERFGNEKEYLDQIIAGFKHGDEIDMVIVVDKLLTGFDAPRNTVLYVDKSLKEHSLIQAISRVNRLHEDKDYGYIIDYRGILGELDEALEMYSALSEYDPEDVGGAITDVAEEVAKLAQRHSIVLDVFKELPNRKDIEACENLLFDDSVRDKFYEALTSFGRTLKLAMSSVSFIENTPDKKVHTYLSDLKFYNNMRQSVRYRYAEAFDIRPYDDQIKKLLDTYITSSRVEQVTQQVNIHDKEERREEVVKIVGEAAQADHIAHKLKATCVENLDKDPAYYERFSKLIQEAINDYRNQRLAEREYLARVRNLESQVLEYTEDQLPDRLSGYVDARAYYHAVREPLASYGDNGSLNDNLAADVGIRVEEIIEANKVRDWINNPDVQNQMKNEIDDYLYELQADNGLELSSDQINELLGQLIDIARKRS